MPLRAWLEMMTRLAACVRGREMLMAGAVCPWRRYAEVARPARQLIGRSFQSMLLGNDLLHSFTSRKADPSRRDPSLGLWSGVLAPVTICLQRSPPALAGVLLATPPCGFAIQELSGRYTHRGASPTT